MRRAERGSRLAPGGARISARGLRHTDCGTQIAARGLRRADCGARIAARGSLRSGTARGARRADCGALGGGGCFNMLRDLRCRAGGGPAAAHIMRASSRRSSAPARPGGPEAVVHGPQTLGPAAAACSPLSCPAPPHPSPVHLHTPNLFQCRITANGRPSPRKARFWKRREGGREAGAARYCCRERGRRPVERQQWRWDCRTVGGSVMRL